MSHDRTIMARSSVITAAMLMSLALALPAVRAQAVDEGPSSPSDREERIGRIEFDYANAPPATVELDLSQGLLADFAGIGQAAIAGVSQALSESSAGSDEAIRQSSEHLQSVNQIVSALTGVIHEVRVRVYDDLGQDASTRDSMVAHYQQKLRGTDWESIVRVSEDNANVNVSAVRSDGAIRGVFVVVTEDDEVVMANIVCELTPEKVQQVTHQATSIGMKMGLEQAIREMMREMQQHRQ
jgi:hypothetical protein